MTRIIINTEFDITTLTVAYWLVHFHSVIILRITTLLADGMYIEKLWFVTVE